MIINNGIELYYFYFIRFYHLQVIIFRNLIEVLSLVEIGNRFGKNHLVEIGTVERLACVSFRSWSALLGRL